MIRSHKRAAAFVLFIPLCCILPLMFLGAAPQDEEEVSRIATLYRLDPLSHTLSFLTGEPGNTFEDHMVKNRQSHIDFDNYYEGDFIVGIEGSQQGMIVDLGPSWQLMEKYGYKETVGGGQGYASIRREGGKVVILDNFEKQTFTELIESHEIFKKPTPDNSHTPARLGHIYLARIIDRRDKDFELMVKFMVISIRPGEKATIRWDII